LLWLTGWLGGRLNQGDLDLLVIKMFMVTGFKTEGAYNSAGLSDLSGAFHVPTWP
jgi:hypothetical protein